MVVSQDGSVLKGRQGGTQGKKEEREWPRIPTTFRHPTEERKEWAPCVQMNEPV